MDRDLKLVFGKLLGEVYRLQGHLDPEGELCQAAQDRIYGLCNGMEREIDGELDALNLVPAEETEKIEQALCPMEYGKTPMDAEVLSDLLDDFGQDKSERVLRLAAAGGRFRNVLKALKEGGSPIYRSITPEV